MDSSVVEANGLVPQWPGLRAIQRIEIPRVIKERSA
jgi:hypothetical protein